jgi:asparagine synthase (glutamine-hydrolysing)
VAFYLLSEVVAREVKVVQCGQGADEVFAGYRYHARAGDVARDHAIDSLTDSFFDRSHLALQAVAVEGALPARDVSRDRVARHLAADHADTALDAVLRLDTHLLMVDDPVKRVDSMTMAWSVEARVPFLDQDLVALAARCPPAMKLDEDGKGVLKRIGRRLLPDEVVDRPKGYFPVPALERLHGPVRDLAREALSPSAARMRSVIRPEEIDRLLARTESERTPVGSTALWPIAVLELWLQRQGVSSPVLL